MEDWGHAKRGKGVASASGEYVGFFNHDDEYHLTYLQKMLTAAAERQADVVYCAWNEQPNCGFAFGSSTAGNFITRTSLARHVGYPHRKGYASDGHFIDLLRARAKTVVKVHDVLYTHH